MGCAYHVNDILKACRLGAFNITLKAIMALSGHVTHMPHNPGTILRRAYFEVFHLTSTL